MGLVANDGSLPPLAMPILGSCTGDELDPHDQSLSPKERASVKKLEAKLNKVAFA